MKAFLSSLWAGFVSRVFVSWKPTLIGLALAVAILVIEQLAVTFAGIPEGWAKYAALAAAAIGAWLKSKAAAYPHPV
jgi:hypothetical protein